MILRGEEFWKAYNGMHISKNTGADYDVLANLEDTCSALFQNNLKNKGLTMSEEERKEIISSYEALIPGSTGRGFDAYFTREHSKLKQPAANTLEGNELIEVELASRKPSFSLRK